MIAVQALSLSSRSSRFPLYGDREQRLSPMVT